MVACLDSARFPEEKCLPGRFGVVHREAVVARYRELIAVRSSAARLPRSRFTLNQGKPTNAVPEKDPVPYATNSYPWLCGSAVPTSTTME
jgi:hypothetical protein